MIKITLFILGIVLFPAASAQSATELAGSRYNNDIAVAEDCINKNASNRNGIYGCLRTLNRWNRGRANYLKCSIYMTYNGLTSIFKLPIFLESATGEQWIFLLNAFSDLDLSLSLAAKIQHSCHRARPNDNRGSVTLYYSIAGEYYLLRALLLSKSSIDRNELIHNLLASDDVALMDAVGNVVSRINSKCNSAPKKAAIRKLSLCSKALDLAHSNSKIYYERFEHSLISNRNLSGLQSLYIDSKFSLEMQTKLDVIQSAGGLHSIKFEDALADLQK